MFSRYICNTALLLDKAIKAKKDILFEGAQGTFLDVDFGTYPFVTSSSTTAGGACTGTGVSPDKIDKIIGVAKAYTTRVGEGPFPTEFSPDFSSFMRDKGREFGATTGRPRRCGWFDSVAVGEAVMLNGITELAIMKMDVLEGLRSVKICTAYIYQGKRFRDFPYDAQAQEKAKPVYIEMPGWDKTIKNSWHYKDLHPNAKAYLNKLSGLLNVKISMVSVGSSREETIFIPPSQNTRASPG